MSRSRTTRGLSSIEPTRRRKTSRRQNRIHEKEVRHEKAVQRREKLRTRWFTLGVGLDMQLLVLILLLLGIGLATLFSASYASGFSEEGGSSFSYIRRQVGFAVLGVFFMLLISTFNY
ncbi:MAG: hypothetical protein Q4C42_04775, partial [Clostridia bacterium]|nr:hypothetical protein [Clostridia bacterium]